MFVCEPTSEYSVNLVGSELGKRFFVNLVGSIHWTAMKLYSGSKKLHSTCSENIRPIWRTLPLIGWEQSFPVDEEEIKIKMADSVTRFFTRFRVLCVYLLTCGRHSLVLGTHNEVVVSWITLWEMIKVYWLDFSLCFLLCCLLRICSKFRLKLASHYKPVENEVKFVELSEPCLVN